MTESDPTKKDTQETHRFCLECGSEIEPGYDFCTNCGSKRVFDVDTDTNRVVLEKGKCPFCGYQNQPEDRFCASCGQRIGEFAYTGRPHRPTGKEYLIIALAVIPGIVDVFGLGHIFLKRYARAAVYLCMSAVLLYIRFTSGYGSGMTFIFLQLICLFIYVKQAMEVLNAVYSGGTM